MPSSNSIAPEMFTLAILEFCPSEDYPTATTIDQNNPASKSKTVILTPTNKCATAILLDYPAGAYTSMRTIGHGGVMNFSGHVTRLTSSLTQIHFPESDKEIGKEIEDQIVKDRLAPFRESTTLKPMLTLLVQKALKDYFGKRMTDDASEAKITLLCTWNTKSDMPILLAHIEPLRVLKECCCKVRVYGSPRQHANAKDSQWVRDRKALLEGLSHDTNEAVLLDETSQNLYEGLSSNFFVYDKAQQAIITAPLDSVLQGTILKIVLAVCENQKIPVQFKFPNLKDINNWEGAFITSTSRLVLPIETMVLPGGSEKQFQESPVIELIRSCVFQECQKRVEILLTVHDLE
ncbi:Sulfhydryl oxidase 1 [Linnemannia zychae]|nr:Sulfhydryl oxidase 1 [Linnemannia zychae]